jgi:hypothetical protein
MQAPEVPESLFRPDPVSSAWFRSSAATPPCRSSHISSPGSTWPERVAMTRPVSRLKQQIRDDWCWKRPQRSENVLVVDTEGTAADAAEHVIRSVGLARDGPGSSTRE